MEEESGMTERGLRRDCVQLEKSKDEDENKSLLTSRVGHQADTLLDVFTFKNAYRNKELILLNNIVMASSSVHEPNTALGSCLTK